MTSSGTIYAIAPGAGKRRVAVSPQLGHAAIRGLAMSRDGTRAALVVETPAGNELDLATVVRSEAGLALRDLRVVVPSSSDVAGVAWANADEIVTTVSGRGGRRGVVEVGTNGYQVHDLSGPGLPSDVAEVAAAPGTHILAAGREGTWELVGERWHKVSAGRAPTYAGG